MAQHRNGRLWRHRMKGVEYRVVGMALIHTAPDCKCGCRMRKRSAQIGTKDDDWVAYECPEDSPENLELHTGWVVLRAKEAE